MPLVMIVVGVALLTRYQGGEYWHSCCLASS